MTFNMSVADKISSLFFGLLGTAMLVGGFQMDRLEIRQIHPASIPGLVPMMLGVALIVCSVLLFYEAHQSQTINEETGNSSGSWNDLFVSALMSCIYALLLVGWLPFFLATGIYITTFILYFSRNKIIAPETRIRSIVTAVIIGSTTAVAISALFRYGFLVRLP